MAYTPGAQRLAKIFLLVFVTFRTGNIEHTAHANQRVHDSAQNNLARAVNA